LSRRSAGWDTGRWCWTRNPDSSGSLSRKNWSAFVRPQKGSGAGRSQKWLAAAMLPNGESCPRWRRSQAARAPRRHLRGARRASPLRDRTHRKSPPAPRTIGNNPGLSAPLARLAKNSVLPGDTPMPQERLSAHGNPQRVDSCQGWQTRAQGVPRNSARDAQPGRKKTAVPAPRRHSVRLRVIETAVQGTEVGRPPRGRLRVARDRLTRPAPALAASAQPAHLAPSRPGTRGKVATVRDSIEADQAPKAA
jgi:hypothetical protein